MLVYNMTSHGKHHSWIMTMLAETAVPLNHVLGRKPVQLTLDHGTLTVTVIAVPEPGAGSSQGRARSSKCSRCIPCCRHVVRDRGLHVGIAAAGEDRRPCAPTGCADLDLLNHHDVPKFDGAQRQQEKQGRNQCKFNHYRSAAAGTLAIQKARDDHGVSPVTNQSGLDCHRPELQGKTAGGASIGPLEITNAKIRTASLTTSNGSGAVRLGLATADGASVQL